MVYGVVGAHSELEDDVGGAHLFGQFVYCVEQALALHPDLYHQQLGFSSATALQASIYSLCGCGVGDARNGILLVGVLPKLHSAQLLCGWW